MLESAYYCNGDLEKTLAVANGTGLNILRVFGHGSGSDVALMTGPGEYNEKAFQALDTVVAKAGDA